MSDLFILGAGASVPYGFPTGLELFESIKSINYDINYDETPILENNICTKIIRKINYEKNKNNPLYKDYIKFYGEPHNEEMLKIMEDFSNEVKNSTMISIDDFLRNRKNLDQKQLDFGKRIIASKILEAEQNSLTGKYKENVNDKKEKEYKNKIDWLNYLLSFIDRNKNLEDNFFNSKFIIFNYDRLFEQKIFEYLRHDKNLSEEYVLKKIDSMKIIHIHGYIGNLNDIKFGDNENKNYSSIANNMKTVWENNSENKTKIRRYFSVCNRVFFIGFGWLDDNMNELGLDYSLKKILRGSEIYGTAYKISDYNIKYIEDRLKICGALQTNIKDCEAVDLIRDYF